LEQAENDFRYCQTHRDQWALALDWFLKAVKGPTVRRIIPITGAEVEDCPVVPILVWPAPSLSLDQRMVTLLATLAREFQYFSDLYRHLTYMNMCTEVVVTPITADHPLVHTELQLGMTNYNYHIGFNV